MTKPLFITFEGGEGSGKTTQINRLTKSLSEMGYKVVTTREPGGTPEAEKIRELIVQRDGGNWSPMAETLLLFAARIMHVKTLINPALEEGKIVICDRFADSTVAYQGYGHGVDHHAIEEIYNHSLGHFKPDLTFLLDIDPEIGLQRAGRRLAAESLDLAQREDKFENLDLDFHKRLRQGFLEIANADPARCKIIDASRSLEALSTEILNITRARLN